MINKGKFTQAPELKSTGEKFRKISNSPAPGVMQIPQELFYLIHFKIKAASARALMLFLIGNAANQGFRIPEKTVIDRCGCTQNSYITARQTLIALGWIEHKKNEYITVLYDNMWRDVGLILQQSQETSSTKKQKKKEEEVNQSNAAIVEKQLEPIQNSTFTVLTSENLRKFNPYAQLSSMPTDNYDDDY